MHEGPFITSEILINALLNEGIITKPQLISALGSDRGNPGLNMLEFKLLSNNLVSQARLLALKGLIAELPIWDNPAVSSSPQLSADVAKIAGALVLDREPLTVAFVEDIPLNIEAVASFLKVHVDSIEVWLMTAPQFFDQYTRLYDKETSTSFPEVKDVFEVFDEAARFPDVSNISFLVGYAPALRTGTSIKFLDRAPVSADWLQSQVSLLAGQKRSEEFSSMRSSTFTYSYGSQRYRLNIGSNSNGLTLSARALPANVPSPKELGVPDAARLLLQKPGIVFFSGPSRSGVTTTVASMLAYVNQTEYKSIVTLEDFVEYRLPAARSIVSQRERHQSFLEFSDAVDQSLLQDVDILSLSRVDSHSSAKSVLSAALSGLTVLVNFNGRSVLSAVKQFVTLFPLEEHAYVWSSLSTIFSGGLSQVLVPRVDGSSMAAAFEVLQPHKLLSDHLRSGKLDEALAVFDDPASGSTSLSSALADLCLDGVSRVDEALLVAPDADVFNHRLYQKAGS